MKVTTSRAVFEKLIDLRLAEAKTLLDHGHWDGAYYLAGYAVEYALKVRIIALVVTSDGFPDKKLTETFYRHDLQNLQQAAALKDEMDKDATVGPYWDTVRDWSEQVRYRIGKTEAEARKLYDAVEKGVLPWIKARW